MTIRAGDFKRIGSAGADSVLYMTKAGHSLTYHKPTGSLSVRAVDGTYAELDKVDNATQAKSSAVVWCNRYDSGLID